MQTENSISIRELRTLTDKMFEKLLMAGYEKLNVESSNYWTVFFSDAFKAEAPVVTLGDVNDDIVDLRAEAAIDDESDDRVTCLWHAFHHLSGLITFVAATAEGSV